MDGAMIPSLNPRMNPPEGRTLLFSVGRNEALNHSNAIAPPLHLKSSMKKERQTSFAQLHLTSPTEHGGEHSIGKRKEQRPISVKKTMHIVMKSSKAKGTYSLRAFQIVMKYVLQNE